jgi:Sec-independent protein secretion pathway component TatC
MFVYFIAYPYIDTFASSSNLGVLKLHDLFGGNEYTSYILTVALEVGIILFLMALQKLTNKGEK